MAQAVKSRATLLARRLLARRLLARRLLARRLLARRLLARRLTAWGRWLGPCFLLLALDWLPLGLPYPPAALSFAAARKQGPVGPAAVRPAAPGPAGRQCSLKRPVCVEGGEPEARRTALRLLSDAYELTVLGNQGPAWSLDPRAEPMLWLLEPGRLEFRLERVLTGGFDRGRVRCQGGELTRSTALACAAGSSLGRVVPGTASALTQGFAGYSALLHDAGLATTGALSQAVRTPERGVLSDATLPTAALLVERIVAKATPGQGLAAPWLALLLPATRTMPGAPHPSAEPDLFDVLESTLGSADPHLALFLDELSAVRWSEDGPLGTLASVPAPAWEIDAATLPRNLVLPEPLRPTGSAYVVVALDEETRKAGLALRTYCEGGSRYAWSMARLDDLGRIETRVHVASRDSATSVEGALRQLEGADQALIIGTSLGGGPGAGLDPDETPLPAHTCQVALDRLPTR